MNSRERQSLDNHITGHYGEDQLKGEAEFEAELDRLLNLRDKALRLNSGFQVQQAEAKLNQLCPEWREWIEDKNVFNQAYDYAIKAGCTHEDATFYAQAYVVKSPTGTANHDDTFPDWTIRRSR